MIANKNIKAYKNTEVELRTLFRHTRKCMFMVNKYLGSSCFIWGGGGADTNVPGDRLNIPLCTSVRR